jgi:transposase
MLSKYNSIQRDQLEMITLDQLVPANHLVRKIEASIDFTFIYDLVIDMYSEVGRPSIILVKLTFIQYTFGVRSMRKTIEEVETNMAYRWFLGYGFHDKVPPIPRSGKIMNDALKIQTCLNRFSIAS